MRNFTGVLLASKTFVRTTSSVFVVIATWIAFDLFCSMFLPFQGIFTIASISGGDHVVVSTYSPAWLSVLDSNLAVERRGRLPGSLCSRFDSEVDSDCFLLQCRDHGLLISEKLEVDRFQQQGLQSLEFEHLIGGFNDESIVLFDSKLKKGVLRKSSRSRNQRSLFLGNSDIGTHAVAESSIEITPNDSIQIYRFFDHYFASTESPIINDRRIRVSKNGEQLIYSKHRQLYLFTIRNKKEKLIFRGSEAFPGVLDWDTNDALDVIYLVRMGGAVEKWSNQSGEFQLEKKISQAKIFPESVLPLSVRWIYQLGIPELKP